MNSISLHVISQLDSIINSFDDKSFHHDLIYDVHKSFTRKSKFGLTETIRFILGSGPSTLKQELQRFSNNPESSITPSALVQSRAKIKPELFKSIFHQFNDKFSYPSTYKNYRIIAVDGSKLNIPYNPNDPSSLHHGKPKADGSSGKGYNQVHLSVAYDVLNSRFLDCVIEDIRNYDERAAMLELAKNNPIENAIWVADRGYEGFNLFEHLGKMTNYVIRIKDLTAKNALVTGLNLPNDEFDMDINFTFTNYNRKEYQIQKEKYKIIHKYQTFDFLDEDTHFYDVSWRIVRFKMNEKYEMLITNLSRDLFNAEDLKYIYGLRWKVETAFRYLKHDLNITHFLSRKKEFIRQEIWAKLIMYNLSSIIHIFLENKREKKKKRKLIHKINFSNTIHLLTRTFVSSKRKGGIPPNLDQLIIRETSPIRENRTFVRSPHPQTYKASNYRSY